MFFALNFLQIKLDVPMRVPLSAALALAIAAFATPYGLQYTPIPRMFAPVALKDPLSPEQLASLSAELARMDADLAEATTTATRNDGSLVGALAAARREQLLLTRTMIDNRLRAGRGDAPLTASVAMLTPDPLRAAKIRDAIKGVEAEIADAQAEAAKYSGGLVLAMIISREETAKLQLAQLKAGLYEAELGVATNATSLGIHAPSASQLVAQTNETKSGQAAVDQETVPSVPVPTVVERPAWADAASPEIDYTIEPFASLAGQGFKMSGWWAILEERAPIDDTLSVLGVNVSAYSSGVRGRNPTLIARCQEGETALVFRADTYLMKDYDSYGLPVIYRIDDNPSVSATWSTLTNNEGVGVFGFEGVRFLKQLEGAKKLFVRVTEKGGEQHDAVFQLSGLSPTIEKIKLACKW